MHSILSVGTDPGLTILRSQLLISRGFSVVNVSHVPYAVPIFRSALFNAVILCYTVTESMSKGELTAMVREFEDSPVLVFNKEISPVEENLVRISPRPGEVNRNNKSAQLVSDLQALFRLKTAVPGSLQSWKEISAYMGRAIRTLQRWEKDHGLPVHRPSGRDRSAVFAMKPEIDEWMRNSCGNCKTATAQHGSSLIGYSRAPNRNAA